MRNFDKRSDRSAASEIAPQVTWGTTPQQVLPDQRPHSGPEHARRRGRAPGAERALAYMGLAPGTPMEGIPIDKRVHRLVHQQPAERSARGGGHGARPQGGRRRAGLVVPGSTTVKREAEAEGLDAVFRAPGSNGAKSACSMCAGTNDDTVGAGERCISSTNRNFEGRQGPGARTHLASPAMVAAAAVSGPHRRRSQIREPEPMEKVSRVTGIAAPLMMENIDTDAITPVPWLTNADVDFARALFANWRYADEHGERERADFVLNREPFRHARILVGRRQFRLRQLARARGVGAARLRHSQRDRAELQRHILRELVQERPACHPPCRANRSTRSRARSRTRHPATR